MLRQVLQPACQPSSASAAAWVALAELQLQSDDAAGALATVADGMAWVRQRRESGFGRLASTVLALRLRSAAAHLQLGQLEEADVALQKLSGTHLLLSPTVIAVDAFEIGAAESPAVATRWESLAQPSLKCSSLRCPSCRSFGVEQPHV